MFYKKFNPTDGLKPFIHTYYVWENLNNTSSLIIESPPSAYSAFVFNLGDEYKAGIYGKRLMITPRIFLTGQATKSYSLELQGKISMVGVVLKATTLYYFIEGDQKSLLNKRKDLTDYMGDRLTNLYSELKIALTNKEKISLVDNFLLRILEEKEVTRDKFDESVDFIDSKYGNTTLRDITDQYEFSPRYYQKIFHKRVGVSPKSYMRMRRMSHICHLLTTQKEINWQDIVYEGGYFDQSHFIKDFMDFIGRNPSIYFKNNKELARLLG